MVPIINAVQYFPDKKGLVSGIIVAGFGLGSFVFSYLAKTLMNPDGVNVNGKKWTPENSAANLSVAENLPCNY